MEQTARIAFNTTIAKEIENIATSKTNLPIVKKSSFWKPSTMSLNEYPPKEEVVRLRSFDGVDANVHKMSVIHIDNSYSHTKEKLYSGTIDECEVFLTNQGFEKWVEFSQSAIEYKVILNNIDYNILIESLDSIIQTIKIEAPNQHAIQELLRQFSLNESDIITKNTAELLLENIDKSEAET